MCIEILDQYKAWDQIKTINRPHGIKAKLPTATEIPICTVRWTS